MAETRREEAPVTTTPLEPDRDDPEGPDPAGQPGWGEPISDPDQPTEEPAPDPGDPTRA